MVRQTYRPTAADKKPAAPTKPAKIGIAQPAPKAPSAKSVTIDKKTDKANY